MMKLIKMTLVSALMATSGFTSGLPRIIETGAIAYVNKDLELFGDYNNYGTITTEKSAATLGVIDGKTATITNHT